MSPVALVGDAVGPGGLLLPGFIDTQVDGGRGVLSNDAPTVEGLDRAIHS